MARRTRRLSARERGYTHRWELAAKAYKDDNPLCVMCKRDGALKPVYAVDHIVPHKGDERLFWDQSNWQSLCQRHHNGTKQRIERDGFERGTDIDGRPLAADHPWNKKR